MPESIVGSQEPKANQSLHLDASNPVSQTVPVAGCTCTGCAATNDPPDQIDQGSATLEQADISPLVSVSEARPDPGMLKVHLLRLFAEVPGQWSVHSNNVPCAF